MRPDGDGTRHARCGAGSRARAVAKARAPRRRTLAALQQPSARPGLELLRLLRADGVFTPAAIAIALALSQRRGDLRSNSISRLDRIRPQPLRRYAWRSRPSCCCSKFPITSSLLRFGRRLEIRLRLAFLEKIPRLGDRYFQSRLKSDMAERSHSIHLIRRLPELGGQLLRYSFEIVFTTAGIIWIDPASAPIALPPHSPPSRFRSHRSLC